MKTEQLIQMENKVVTMGREKEGYRKEDKQLQAMLYAIQRMPFINRTQLMKYIFFVDLFYYNKTGDTLLEDNYKRYPRGPVPKYGFDYTTVPEGEDHKKTEAFSIIKEIDEKDPKRYYYRFKLNPEVSANTECFQEGEKDLLRLTLRAVGFRHARDISELTHTYSLWTGYTDFQDIDLRKFKLNSQEEDQLELFLNAKVYLTPIGETYPVANTMKSITSRVKLSEANKPVLTLIQGFPERLPVYFNEQTKKVVEVKRTASFFSEK